MYHLELNGGVLAINVCKDMTHCAIFYNFREAIQYVVDRSMREGAYPIQIEITEGVINYARNADSAVVL